MLILNRILICSYLIVLTGNLVLTAGYFDRFTPEQLKALGQKFKQCGTRQCKDGESCITVNGNKKCIRRGAKFGGDQCDDMLECASKICSNSKCNFNCELDSQCRQLTEFCGPNMICIKKGNINDKCTKPTDCESNICIYQRCSTGLLDDGQPCTDRFECKSKDCHNRKCTTRKDLKARCHYHGECKSNFCWKDPSQGIYDATCESSFNNIELFPDTKEYTDPNNVDRGGVCQRPGEYCQDKTILGNMLKYLPVNPEEYLEEIASGKTGGTGRSHTKTYVCCTLSKCINNKCVADKRQPKKIPKMQNPDAIVRSD